MGPVWRVDVVVAGGRQPDLPEVDRGRPARVGIRDSTGQPHRRGRSRPVGRQLERGDDEHEPVYDDLDRAAVRAGDCVFDRTVDDPCVGEADGELAELDGVTAGARVGVEPVAHTAAKRHDLLEIGPVDGEREWDGVAERDAGP